MRQNMAAISLIALTCLCLILMASEGQSYISLPIEPIANHFALADCVVVGKIVSVAEKPEKGVLYPGMPAGTEFTVIEVETSEILAGPTEIKRVKLAFLNSHLKSQKPVPAVGLEGLFFGVRTPDSKFFLVPVGGFHESKTDTYKKTFEQARRCAKLLAKPDEGLASKDGSDKLLTAYILALRETYNQVRKTGPGVKLKAETMEAERSKRMMMALAEGDWSDKASGANAGNALNWFSRPPLVTPKGFPSGVNSDDKDAVAKARQWLKENAETYRLKRLVLIEIQKK
jgi:hypothetical protein